MPLALILEPSKQLWEMQTRRNERRILSSSGTQATNKHSKLIGRRTWREISLAMVYAKYVVRGDGEGVEFAVGRWQGEGEIVFVANDLCDFGVGPFEILR